MPNRVQFCISETGSVVGWENNCSAPATTLCMFGMLE